MVVVFCSLGSVGWDGVEWHGVQSEMKTQMWHLKKEKGTLLSCFMVLTKLFNQILSVGLVGLLEVCKYIYSHSI